MMHNSHVIVDQLMGKPTRNENKQHIKSDGLYFQNPYDKQKVLSNKTHRLVCKSGMLPYGGNPNYSSYLKKYDNTQFSTYKKIDLKQLTKENDEIRKCFRKHYRVDIKNYIKRVYCRQAYEIPLEALQILRTYSNERNYTKTNEICICKPFFHRGSLKKLLLNNQDEYGLKILKKKKIVLLFRQLLKCSLEFGGLDNFILTTENIYLKFNQDLKDVEFFINYTSFTGLTLIKAKHSIEAPQYVEISAYLTPNMLRTGQIGVQQKIRFFLINALSILKRENLTLVTEQISQNAQFSYDYIMGQITDKQQPQKVSKKIIQLFQTSIEIQRQNPQLESKYERFYQILDGCLVKNEELTWDEIVQCIYDGKQKKQKEKQKENSEQYKKNLDAFKNLHKNLYQAEEDQSFYSSRNISSELLYIPIKYQANLNAIFNYQNWWDVFNINQNQFYDKSSNNSDFGFRLLNGVISRYESKHQSEELAQKLKSQLVVVQKLFEYLQKCQQLFLFEFPVGKQSNITFKQIVQKFKSSI